MKEGWYSQLVDIEFVKQNVDIPQEGRDAD
jgi:hypothetical protein